MTRSRELLREKRRNLDDRKRYLTDGAPSYFDWPDKIGAQKEFVKKVIDNDNEVSNLEIEIDELQGDVDGLKSAIRHHELGINALAARMTELGGLLHFYAEVKRAETSPTSITSPASPVSPTQETGEQNE